MEFIPLRGNSRFGRWLQVDPLADKFAGWSPYNYVLNNPLRLIDPNGRAPQDDLENVNPANIILTTIFDVKHSALNLIFNAFVDKPEGMKWEIGYARDEFGNEIFKSEKRLVPSEGVVKDGVGYALDAANVALAGRSKDASGLLAKGVGGNQVTNVAKSYSEATFKSFKNQLLSGGKSSLLSSQGSIQKKLTEHMKKLEEVKKAGGYTSSIEREIRTFKSQLNAINDLLK